MGYFTYPIPVKALNDIYKTTQKSLGKLLEKNHSYIVAAWRTMECILYTVDKEGVLALEGMYVLLSGRHHGNNGSYTGV